MLDGVLTIVPLMYWFEQYIKTSYTRKQLLGIQMFLRNEEFNEIGNQILSNLLRESDTKENTHDN